MSKSSGRPTKLTPELEKAIIEAIEQGNFRMVAAEAAGLHATTFSKWMRRGRRQPRGPFGDFAKRVRAAERKAEIEMVKVVTAGAKADPKHAQWWLERKFSERWGRKDSIKAELSGQVGIDGLADLLQAGHDEDDREKAADRVEAVDRAVDRPDRNQEASAKGDPPKTT